MTYPISYPSNSRLTPRTIKFTQNQQATAFQSPFTGQTQVMAYQGSWFSLDVTLSPLIVQSDAEQMVAFLGALRGTVGSFLFPLPSMFTIATTTNLTVSANGTDFTGGSQTISPGKYGYDNNYRLVLFTSTSSLFPTLPTGANTISNTGGAGFRLASNQVSWDVSQLRQTAATFSVIEAMGMF